MPTIIALTLAACLAAVLAESVCATYAPTHAKRIGNVLIATLSLFVAASIFYGLTLAN